MNNNNNNHHHITPFHAPANFEIGRYGTVLDEQTRRERARFRGLCEKCCQVQTHRGIIIRRALTNNDVWQGICIRCNTYRVPTDVLLDYYQRNHLNSNVTRASSSANNQNQNNQYLDNGYNNNNNNGNNYNHHQHHRREQNVPITNDTTMANDVDGSNRGNNNRDGSSGDVVPNQINGGHYDCHRRRAQSVSGNRSCSATPTAPSMNRVDRNMRRLEDNTSYSNPYSPVPYLLPARNVEGQEERHRRARSRENFRSSSPVAGSRRRRQEEVYGCRSSSPVALLRPPRDVDVISISSNNDRGRRRRGDYSHEERQGRSRARSREGFRSISPGNATNSNNHRRRRRWASSNEPGCCNNGARERESTIRSSVSSALATGGNIVTTESTSRSSSSSSSFPKATTASVASHRRQGMTLSPRNVVRNSKKFPNRLSSCQTDDNNDSSLPSQQFMSTLDNNSSKDDDDDSSSGSISQPSSCTSTDKISTTGRRLGHHQNHNKGLSTADFNNSISEITHTNTTEDLTGSFSINDTNTDGHWMNDFSHFDPNDSFNNTAAMSNFSEDYHFDYDHDENNHDHNNQLLSGTTCKNQGVVSNTASSNYQQAQAQQKLYYNNYNYELWLDESNYDKEVNTIDHIHKCIQSSKQDIKMLSLLCIRLWKVCAVVQDNSKIRMETVNIVGIIEVILNTIHRQLLPPVGIKSHISANRTCADATGTTATGIVFVEIALGVLTSLSFRVDDVESIDIKAIIVKKGGIETVLNVLDKCSNDNEAETTTTSTMFEWSCRFLFSIITTSAIGSKYYQDNGIKNNLNENEITIQQQRQYNNVMTIVDANGISSIIKAMNQQQHIWKSDDAQLHAIILLRRIVAIVLSSSSSLLNNKCTIRRGELILMKILRQVFDNRFINIAIKLLIKDHSALIGIRGNHHPPRELFLYTADLLSYVLLLSSSSMSISNYDVADNSRCCNQYSIIDKLLQMMEDPEYIQDYNFQAVCCKLLAILLTRNGSSGSGNSLELVRNQNVKAKKDNIIDTIIQTIKIFGQKHYQYQQQQQNNYNNNESDKFMQLMESCIWILWALSSPSSSPFAVDDDDDDAYVLNVTHRKLQKACKVLVSTITQHQQKKNSDEEQQQRLLSSIEILYPLNGFLGNFFVACSSLASINTMEQETTRLLSIMIESLLLVITELKREKQQQEEVTGDDNNNHINQDDNDDDQEPKKHRLLIETGRIIVRAMSNAFIVFPNLLVRIQLMLSTKKEKIAFVDNVVQLLKACDFSNNAIDGVTNSIIICCIHVLSNFIINTTNDSSTREEICISLLEETGGILETLVPSSLLSSCCSTLNNSYGSLMFLEPVHYRSGSCCLAVVEFIGMLTTYILSNNDKNIDSFTNNNKETSTNNHEPEPKKLSSSHTLNTYTSNKLIQCIIRLVDDEKYEFMKSIEIRVKVCTILQNLLMLGSSNCGTILFEKEQHGFDLNGFCHFVINMIDSSNSEVELQAEACRIAWVLTVKNPNLSNNQLQLFFKCVLRAINNHRGISTPFNLNVADAGIGALMSITFCALKNISITSDDNPPFILSREDINDILSFPYHALQNTFDAIQLFENLLAMMLNLSLLDEKFILSGGITVVVADVMFQYEMYPTIQQYGCTIMALLASSEEMHIILGIMQLDGIDLLIHALAIYTNNSIDICIQCVKALAHVCIDKECRAMIISLGGLHLIVEAMKYHYLEDCIDFMEGCFTVLYKLTLNIRDNNTAELQLEMMRINGNNDIPTDVIFELAHIITIVMDKYSNSVTLQENGLRIIQNISVIDGQSSNRIIVTAAGGIGAVINAIKNHIGIQCVLENAFQTLLILGEIESNSELIADKNGACEVVNAMMSVISHGTAQVLAIKCLLVFAMNNTINKISIQHFGGIDAIVYAMWSHYNNARLQSYACCALATIILVDDNIESIKTNSVIIAKGTEITAIIYAMRVHTTNKDVQKQGCIALRNILLSNHNVSQSSSQHAEIIKCVKKAAKLHPNGCVAEVSKQVLERLNAA